MGLILLIALTVLLPPFWGWAIHWILSKWWPLQEPDTLTPPGPESRPFPQDYQI
jgi:hypothetical protein